MMKWINKTVKAGLQYFQSQDVLLMNR